MLSSAERARNLARIATAAVAVERSHGVPAELTVGQCILESAWLERAPANNAFGIKAATGAAVYQTVATTEYLNTDQLAKVRASGRKITGVSPTMVNGKYTVALEDRFAVFGDLTECFTAYAELLTKGRYFAARFERYKEHGSLDLLMKDLAGADGAPPYFTAPTYVMTWRTIISQANAQEAIRLARAAATAGDPTTKT